MDERQPTTGSAEPQSHPTALVMAHPGHELRVHAWLARTRPRVFVLTDGSGHQGHGRLASTTKVLAQAGATCGPVFGRLSDRAAYQLILNRDVGAVTALAGELAAAFAQEQVGMVASDAVEGFNPVHDLCWVLTDAAARMATRRSGQLVRHYDFALEAAPDSRAVGSCSDGLVRLVLDAAAWQRKLEAVQAYAELRYEVERSFAGHGEDAFRVELLRPVDANRTLAERVGVPPFYESFGERRVAAGVYDRVLRFREHFLPLADAVRDWAAKA